MTSMGWRDLDAGEFCGRQPMVCVTADFIATKLEAKAKYSAKLIYEWANEASSTPAVPVARSMDSRGNWSPGTSDPPRIAALIRSTISVNTSPFDTGWNIGLMVRQFW